ncbi:hypothetical protein [Mycolicibacterium madagascariense]|nr:hypothetical protein [Mycolicibacterium madagascariense]
MLAVAVLTGSAVGVASPANADPVMQGVYDYTQGDVHAVWTIYPSCVPTVGDLRNNVDLPVGCRLHVAPTPATAVRGGDARQTGGMWEFTTNVQEGLSCPDGTSAPTQETYKWDDVTLTGTRMISNGAVCNGTVPANLVRYPFTLAFNAPLPIPVQQDPLYCEPGGLKRCF